MAWTSKRNQPEPIREGLTSNWRFQNLRFLNLGNRRFWNLQFELGSLLLSLDAFQYDRKRAVSLDSDRLRFVVRRDFRRHRGLSFTFALGVQVEFDYGKCIIGHAG